MRTFGGNANGGCCIFPFKYKGNEYNDCIMLDNDELWCGTTYETSKWGTCIAESE